MAKYLPVDREQMSKPMVEFKGRFAERLPSITYLPRIFRNFTRILLLFLRHTHSHIDTNTHFVVARNGVRVFIRWLFNAPHAKFNCAEKIETRAEPRERLRKQVTHNKAGMKKVQNSADNFSLKQKPAVFGGKNDKK